MRDQRGFMTMDFIFAIVLIMGFWMLLFAISMTLTTASVVQYVTFSAARNYFAAHASPTMQVEKAEQKYRELIENGVIRPLVKNGWFEIYDQPSVGNIAEQRPGYDTTMSNQYFGVGTNFTARILDFKIPFFGSTDPEGDGTGQGFQTFLASFLGREPTAQECWKFTAERWKAIRRLSVSNGAPYSTETEDGAYNIVEDSGC